MFQYETGRLLHRAYALEQQAITPPSTQAIRRYLYHVRASARAQRHCNAVTVRVIARRLQSVGACGCSCHTLSQACGSCYRHVYWIMALIECLDIMAEAQKGLW